MAYGEKYSYTFQYGYTSGTNEYKLAIYEDGYASTVTTLQAAGNPFTLSLLGQREDIGKNILGTRGTFNFQVNQNDLITYDAQFLADDYKNKIVKLISDPSGSADVVWVGFLRPQDSYRQFIEYRYIYNIVANDGIEDLKKFYYTDNGNKDGVPYSGFDDMLTILKTAISKMADISEFQHDFRIQLGTYSDQMTSTENAFKENEIAQELFYDDDGNPDSCYDVIQKIISPFYCTFMFNNGYYWIFCNGERSSYYFEYDWSTLTQQSRTSYSRSENIYQASDKKKLIGEGNLYKVSGYRYITATLNNKAYLPALIPNPEFDGNITGWTNGPADGGIELFDSISYYNYPLIGGTLYAIWSGGATAGFYMFQTTSTFSLTVGASAPTVRVTIAAEQSVFTHSGSGPNLLRARLWNGTNGYIDASEGQIPFYATGGFQSFQFTFSVTGATVGNNYLEIEVEVQDSTTTDVRFYFDYIRIIQQTTQNPADYEYEARRATGMTLEDKEIDFYIGDQLESSNDLCAIKDSGGNYTSSWDRYGATDGDELIEIALQYLINDFSTYKDYADITIYDVNEEIEPIHMLYDSAVSARYYDIVGFTKTYSTAELQVNLKQNGILPGDTSIYIIKRKLDTNYGQG